MQHRTGSVTDFDFLHGDWTVTNRRLRERWVRCDEWDVFTGHHRCEPRLGGVVNVDQMDVPERDFSGMSLRSFDREQRRWSIWWITDAAGRLEPPVHGGFDGTTGVFEGDDLDGDVPVRVRFRWDVLDADRARWQQAFSRDGDEWETNWVMDFTRR